jgi:hypothetical protein
VKATWAAAPKPEVISPPRRRRLRRLAVAQAPAPWLTPGKQHLASCILRSFERAFGRPLLAGGTTHDGLQASQLLFRADTVVLAHDGGPDPALIYANAAALQLWERNWADMIGMPSRLTAEPQERASRAQMLANALQQHASEGYSGVRISQSGRRFQIHNARLWTLWGPGDLPCGQAAAFSSWWWL